MTFYAVPSAPEYGRTASCKNFKDAVEFGEFFPNGFAVYCEVHGKRVLVYANNYLSHCDYKRIYKELDMTEANSIHQKWVDSL